MTEKIKLELLKKRHFTCTCLVCDERMNKEAYIQCECTEGDFEGLLICQTCLKEGNFDERLEARAARLDASAAKVRQLRGRIVAPSYEAWKAENDEVAAAYALVRAYEAAAFVDDECPF